MESSCTLVWYAYIYIYAYDFLNLFQSLHYSCCSHSRSHSFPSLFLSIIEIPILVNRLLICWKTGIRTVDACWINRIRRIYGKPVRSYFKLFLYHRVQPCLVSFFILFGSINTRKTRWSRKTSLMSSPVCFSMKWILDKCHKRMRSIC